MYENLSARLLGISLASFSSGNSDCFVHHRNATSLLVGLGELTFLQLSTTYNRSVGGHSVGWAHSLRSANFSFEWTSSYFASGTGAAGLVGAFLWWEIRGFGVRLGVGFSAVCRLFSYSLAIGTLLRCQILPILLPLTYFLLLPRPATFMDPPSPGSYSPLPDEDPDISAVDVAEGDTLLGQPSKVPVFLSARDKWRLVRPMIFKYMLPLCKCSF